MNQVHVYASVLLKKCVHCPSLKALRQSAIRDLLSTFPIASQDELRRKLAERGFQATQATLSRDIREMRLLKGRNGYALSDAPPPAPAPDDLPAIAEMLSSFGLELRQAQNLLVLLTGRGAAHPVAAGIDDEEWPEVLGTIAGDNTILIICTDEAAASSLRQRLEVFLA